MILLKLIQSPTWRSQSSSLLFFLNTEPREITQMALFCNLVGLVLDGTHEVRISKDAPINTPHSMHVEIECSEALTNLGEHSKGKSNDVRHSSHCFLSWRGQV